MILTSSNSRLVNTCPSGLFFSSAAFFGRGKASVFPADEGFPSVFLGGAARFGGSLAFCSSMYFRRSSCFYFLRFSIFFLRSLSSSSRSFLLLSDSSNFMPWTLRNFIFSAGVISLFCRL